MTPNNYLNKVPDDVDKTQEEWEKLDYHTQYYHANEDRREQMREASRKRYKRKSEKINEVKAESGCAFCDEDEPVCLDFHHTEDKDSWVSYLLRDDASWERIESEMEQCKVVCSNCHRKLHAGLLKIERLK